MLFNSLEFLLFLLASFFIYWKLDHKKQNIFLVFASYIFYAFWDWRFLFLIITSTLVDFFIGQAMEKKNWQGQRKKLLLTSICVNLGILGFFKYFNFFVSSFQELLLSFGATESSLTTLNIILPVGISFYTFQTLSYTIEVYWRKIKPTKNLIEFAGFVSFFPQLVAGPIERASRLLGQFTEKRFFNYSFAVEGLQQMLWGFFKKIVIADSLALFVNQAYGAPANFLGWQLSIATLFFALQIYCDFSGYSDIAIGTAKLFGFKLMTNFRYPYFSKNIIEFWQRWHISLSTWFRDYVYIPLGGSRVKTVKYIRNIMITFLVSGLWHGANWTFVFWGALHGLYFIPQAITKDRSRYKALKETSSTLKDIHKMAFTFAIVLLAWVFFRANNVAEGFYIIKKIILDIPHVSHLLMVPLGLLLISTIFILMEWPQRKWDYPLQLKNTPKRLRLAIYYILIVAILFFGNFGYNPFIYFQF